MKTLNTLALTVLLTSMSVYAQEAAETTREINAQTTVTRGHIDNIIQRMNDRRMDSRFNAKDYWAQNDAFRSSIDVAMKNFEETLEKGILAKAAYWMDQYNSIYKSKEFSAEQKSILLKQRLENIRNQFAALSTEYQAAQRKVYALIPSALFQTKLEVLNGPMVIDIAEPSDHQLKVRLSGNGRSYQAPLKLSMVGQKNYYQDIHVFYPSGKEIIEYNDGFNTTKNVFDDYHNDYRVKRVELEGYTHVKKNRYSFNFTEFLDLTKMSNLKITFFQKEVFATFKGSCKSQICLGLRASDQASLLSLVKSNLDRTITMKLADGNTLSLRAMNLDVKETSSYLAMVDYPVELPFDI